MSEYKNLKRKELIRIIKAQDLIMDSYLEELEDCDAEIKELSADVEFASEVFDAIQGVVNAEGIYDSKGTRVEFVLGIDGEAFAI